MTWAAILSGFLKVFGAVADYLRDRQLLSAGEHKARSETAEATKDAIIEKANIDARVDGMSTDELARELQRWQRETKDEPNS